LTPHASLHEPLRHPTERKRLLRLGVHEDGTEEAYFTGMMREQAERILKLVGQPIRYDERQMKLNL
jgi:hypothetical protein